MASLNESSEQIEQKTRTTEKDDSGVFCWVNFDGICRGLPVCSTAIFRGKSLLSPMTSKNDNRQICLIRFEGQWKFEFPKMATLRRYLGNYLDDMSWYKRYASRSEGRCEITWWKWPLVKNEPENPRAMECIKWIERVIDDTEHLK